MENHDRKHPESISQPLQAGTSTSDGEVLHNLIQEVSTLWDEHEPTEINRPFDWNDYLPTFEQLSKDHQNFPNVFYQSNHNNFYRQKFLRDIRPGDRICATVKRTGIVVLQVELVCMLERFRRCLSFMERTFEIPYDRAKRVYGTSDHIAVTVASVNTETGALGLMLNEDEAIIPQENLPSYFRSVSKPSSYETDEGITRHRDNSNIGSKLRIRINSRLSALPNLAGKRFDEPLISAEILRKAQTKNLAMTHVLKGAELTREGKLFEATQLFNKALAVDEACADAYVGRGAAAAGNRNFSVALQDFDHAIELQPTHKNALRYKIDVLIAYAKDLEKEKSYNLARENFNKVLELSESHPLALEGLKRIGVNYQRSDVIELSDDEEQQQTRNGTGEKQRRVSESIEDVEKNRKRLREMEVFIENLKKSK